MITITTSALPSPAHRHPTAPRLKIEGSSPTPKAASAEEGVHTENVGKLFVVGEKPAAKRPPQAASR